MNLEIFKKDNLEVRVIKDENNEPLFCLKDVCDVLELTNSRMVSEAVKREFEDDVSLTYPIQDSLGRMQNATDTKNAILREFELPRLNLYSFDTGFGIKEFARRNK